MQQYSEIRVHQGFNYKRILVAVVAVPLLISYVYFLPVTFFLLLLLVVAVLALREFYVMYDLPSSLQLMGIVTGGVLLLLLCKYPGYQTESIIVSMLLIMILRLLMIRTPEKSMAHVGHMITGFVYIVFLLSLQWQIRQDVHGVEYIIILYAAVWVADSMAYYIGKYLGRYKLYQAMSPNKTVEGAAGSLVGGAAGAWIAARIINLHEISIGSLLIIGIMIGVATMAGDLIESMFKRDAGVKDSSNIIPGHGGLLDKIDGLLVAGPVFYIIVMYLL